MTRTGLRHSMVWVFSGMVAAAASLAASQDRWECFSVEGVAQSYQNGNWRKFTQVQSYNFGVSEVAPGKLEFSDFLMMADPTCVTNPDIPWISCSTPMKMFVLNTKSGDGVLADTGTWVIREKMREEGLPQLPVAMDVIVFKCTRLSKVGPSG